MAHAQYLPETVEGKLDHVQEECAEVILAIAKMKRFGWESRNPAYPDSPTNIHHLRQEIGEAIFAMQRFMTALGIP